MFSTPELPPVAPATPPPRIAAQPEPPPAERPSTQQGEAEGTRRATRPRGRNALLRTRGREAGLLTPLMPGGQDRMGV